MERQLSKCEANEEMSGEREGQCSEGEVAGGGVKSGYRETMVRRRDHG